MERKCSFLIDPMEQAENLRLLRAQRKLCGSPDKQIYIPEMRKQLEDYIAACSCTEECLTLIQEFAYDISPPHLGLIFEKLMTLDAETGAALRSPIDRTYPLISNVTDDYRFEILEGLCLSALSDLPTENLATVLYSLGKLRPDGPSPASKSKLVPALLSEVAHRLEPQYIRFTPKQKLKAKHISSILSALVKLRHTHPPTELLVTLARHAEQELVCFDESMLCNLCTCFGQLQHPPDEVMLVSVFGQLGRKLHKLSPNKLAKLVGACTKLKFAPNKLFQDCARIVTPQMHNTSPAVLIELSHNLAMLEWNESRSVDNFVVAACDHPEYPQLQLSHIVSLLWVIPKVCQSKLLHKRAHAKVGQLVESCAQKTEQLQHSPGIVVQMSWALAVLEQYPSVHLAKAISQCLEQHSSQFGSPELCTIIWSLVTLFTNSAGKVQFDIALCASVVTAEIVRKLEHINTAGISTVLSAFAKLYAKPNPQIEHFDMHCEMLQRAASAQLPIFSTAGLAALCSSLGSLLDGRHLRSPESVASLMITSLELAVSRIDSFTPSELIGVLCGMASSCRHSDGDSRIVKDWKPLPVSMSHSLIQLFQFTLDHVVQQLKNPAIATATNGRMITKLASLICTLPLSGLEEMMILVAPYIEQVMRQLDPNELLELMIAYGCQRNAPPNLLGMMISDVDRQLRIWDVQQLWQLQWCCEALGPALKVLYRRLTLELAQRALRDPRLDANTRTVGHRKISNTNKMMTSSTLQKQNKAGAMRNRLAQLPKLVRPSTTLPSSKSCLQPTRSKLGELAKPQELLFGSLDTSSNSRRVGQGRFRYKNRFFQNHADIPYTPQIPRPKTTSAISMSTFTSL